MGLSAYMSCGKAQLVRGSYKAVRSMDESPNRSLTRTLLNVFIIELIRLDMIQSLITYYTNWILGIY